MIYFQIKDDENINEIEIDEKEELDDQIKDKLFPSLDQNNEEDNKEAFKPLSLAPFITKPGDELSAKSGSDLLVIVKETETILPLDKKEEVADRLFEKENDSDKQVSETGDASEKQRKENRLEPTVMKATATVSPFLNLSMRNLSSQNSNTVTTSSTTMPLSPPGNKDDESFASALRKLAQQAPGFPAQLMPREHSRHSPPYSGKNGKGEFYHNSKSDFLHPICSDYFQ